MNELTRSELIGKIGLGKVIKLEHQEYDFGDRLDTDYYVDFVAQLDIDDDTTARAHILQKTEDVDNCRCLSELDWDQDVDFYELQD